MASKNNSEAKESRVLRAGVWAPIPAFMDESEELDIPTFQAHVVALARAGMQPVVNGSMGEAHHLTAEERTGLIRAAREALDRAGLEDTVIIGGTGGNSTRATIALCKSAAEAGADVAIVIPPGYFAGALSKAAIKTFFADVATASPIPVMIYNYPGAAGGLDMDSDTIVEIARENANICGVKLTCGAVGKLTRIAGGTQPSALAKYPRAAAVAPEFITLGGFADFLLPTVGAGRGHGAIMGLGNVYPRSIVKLMSLALKEQAGVITKEEKEEALRLQDLCAGADAAFAKAGIAGTKWWLKTHSGKGSARVRRPLLETTEEAGSALQADPAIQAFWEVEQSLARE
ncbi:aldolase [Cutaneotrichosporon oleaginosum]|uniref:Aldolase n=1 Tax=Cutaneotrichosporon oleaginosum TaxID=879819 RepID=A0A0J0XVP6_9TREE|nr:aldolase [Cutaneotrichosporon oleaginosum]KLT45136.1 aldolase [Cutaneotrichosporon oleaginosum]TXT09816.1 hypothetical protein COLE_03750 [Cutaneotrichosporon oleaginosum]